MLVWKSVWSLFLLGTQRTWYLRVNLQFQLPGVDFGGTGDGKEAQV